MSDALAENVVRFGRVLRLAGLGVGTEHTREFARSMTLLGLAARDDLKAAGRAIFVRRRAEIPLYDAAFDLFWRRSAAVGGASDRLPRLRSTELPSGVEPPRGRSATQVGAEPSTAPTRRAASLLERLGRLDFAAMTPAELGEAAAFISTMAAALPQRPSRRPTVHRRGCRLAPRSMLRRSLPTGGEVLDWRWTRRRLRPRPLVVVADVSGSMETYSRLLLRFAHALGRTGAPLEAFVFGTRLTRITRELRDRNVDQALRRIGDKVRDWSGGTRIGASLRELNRLWVRRAVRSGAVVLLVSDGLERDDPAMLSRELATLRRSCRRLIWLNPLASQAGFEPATRGMRAALPHLDALLGCGTLHALADIGHELPGILSGSRVRRGLALRRSQP